MKVCIFTGTRADFGLLKKVMSLIEGDKSFELVVLASGTHLDEDYGLTIEEVRHCNFSKLIEIPIIQRKEGKVSMDESFAVACKEYSRCLHEHKPDLSIVLGDRYEALAMTCSSYLNRVPVAHIHGGEVSEGALDEGLRHAITKMSTFHFTSAEIHSRRVKQLGENPDFVWCVGAPGLDAIKDISLLGKEALCKEFGFESQLPMVVGTIHPETVEEFNYKAELEKVFTALEKHKDLQILWTKSNADRDGDSINALLKEYCQSHEKHILVSSLGAQKYFSAVAASEFVIGNSSSGLIEVPLIGIPTINIGKRQRGRLSGSSVLNVDWSEAEISKAIQQCQDKSFRESLEKISPYGTGQSSEKIVSHLKNIKKIPSSKPFFDMKELV